jgi:hypothetical protein
MEATSRQISQNPNQNCDDPSNEHGPLRGRLMQGTIMPAVKKQRRDRDDGNRG